MEASHVSGTSGASKRMAFLAALLLAGASAGAGDVWLGAGVGQVKPEGVNATLSVSGELRLGLGRHFAIQPDIGYWKRTETVAGVSVSASDLSFGASALAIFPVHPVVFFVGGGPSIHHLGGDVGYYGFSVASSSLTRFGFATLGGLDIRISRSFAFFLGARYDWVGLETTNPDSINQSRLYGGFRLRL
ncbi:MAG TPA: outer membrane beta-barrel protein [Vicinamibacteria bacterium]|nr:outer membrane beta-barrel protein [Vicinamibacteria bacterium]